MPDGSRIWLLDGRLFHRVDGPAVVRPDGSTEWWRHGWLHRDDGPAIVGPGDRREWWVHGRPVWSDGQPVDTRLVRHDDYSCIGTGHPAGPLTRARTVDLRDDLRRDVRADLTGDVRSRRRHR
jgi:hypothetical protein